MKYTAQQIRESISYWESFLLESKITDLIAKNKWTKKDALKPENFKQLKQAWKQGDEVMKKVVDRVFGSDGKFVGEEKAAKALKEISKEKKAPKASEEKKDEGKKDSASAEAEVKPDKKDDAAAKEIVAKKEEVETAVGDFNINARLHRIHNGAVNKVKQNLGQFLNKQKAGSPETVIVTNSCDHDTTFEVPEDGKMYVTIAVKLDKTQITGFRKMVALMKENEDEFFESCNEGELNEGFFSDFVAGLKKGAKALGDAAKETAAKMGDTAKEKLEVAHEKLKKNIGIEAMRTYVTAFCGKKLGDMVSLKNIAMNEDEEGTEGAEITFKCLINIK